MIWMEIVVIKKSTLGNFLFLFFVFFFFKNNAHSLKLSKKIKDCGENIYLID